MAEYQFVTRWQLSAPIESVWEAIVHSEDWHQWWEAIASVEELRSGAVDGTGNRRRMVWKTPLSYTLAFETEVVEVVAPVRLKAVAIGDVEGSGVWELSSREDGSTDVFYTWIVRTTKPWMNVLAMLARPLLEWNHHVVMRRGGIGLARYLNADLLEMESVDRSRTPSPRLGGAQP